MFGMFIKDKNARVLLVLKNTNTEWHLSRIARETKTTYVYVTKFIGKLEQIGLVTLELKGKKRIAKLTEKGTIIANLIDELRSKLG